MAAVCTAAISSIQPVLQAKRLRLTTAFDSVNGVVMDDRNRLQQIIWNLLTNAAKFTPKGGRIHVTLERVNSHLELAVRDNGIGIKPELMPVIFDRFRQGDASTTRRHGGLGLGLPIAKHLVELHGGMLSARSEGEGMGSTFIISLPVTAAHFDENKSAAASRNAAVDDEMEGNDLHGFRILVVDDDEDSLTVIRRILLKHHAMVHAASSVDEALAGLETFKPEIVISDIGMPDRDGYDFIREMR
ncbi:ATP-binding protein [Prosthecobacter sp.]|uniref:hybrid sensor histidine kinase/response regulator n=1 Tax=Prosthecobacter sp. TaxID=1965333 RepID=UPI0037834324